MAQFTEQKATKRVGGLEFQANFSYKAFLEKDGVVLNRLCKCCEIISIFSKKLLYLSKRWYWILVIVKMRAFMQNINRLLER